jgi:hypothetical protein
MATEPTAPNSPRRAAAKAGGARTAKPKLVQGAEPALTVVGEDDETANGKVAGPGLRLKELVDRVVAATGGKKKGVKEVVEAALLQMGEALQRGESLNLPAFGKLRVARASTEDGGAMTLKLRQGPPAGAKGKAAKDAIADSDDQD